MKNDVGKALLMKGSDGWAVGYWDVAGTLFLPIITPSTKHLGAKAQSVVTEQIKKAMPAATSALKGFLKKKKK
jgi:hypothetical protein